MQVAQTILEQLGGNKFLVMTGVSQLVDGGDFLKMKLPRNSCKATILKITLNDSDTYDMEFIKINRKTFECTTILKRAGIYNDMLQICFTEATGLYTSL